MKRNIILSVSILLFSSLAIQAQNEFTEGKIIFQDTFDQKSNIPDTAVWILCTPARNAWSQHFEHVKGYENVKVENGKLILLATKQDGYYKNGGIRTKIGFPCNTRVSVKARLNKLVKGGFPAIWQMPLKGKSWPISGEVDIMEWVQGTPKSVYQTVHTSYNEKHSSNHDTGVTSVTDDIDVTEYHVYSADRTPEAVIFYIDGVEKGRYSNFHNDEESIQFPFCELPFDIILNYSLGGELNGRMTWPGPIDDKDLPGEFIIDWVTVSELSD